MFGHNPESKEPWTPSRLISYFQGQFADAIKKEEAKNERGESTVPNGTFIQYVPLYADHPLVTGAYNIVMKDPHPYDKPGVFGEIFALGPFEQTDLDRKRVPLASTFVVHDVNEIGDKWYVIDENGAYELIDFDAVDFTDETPANDSLRLVGSIGNRYGVRNIVAIGMAA